MTTVGEILATLGVVADRAGRAADVATAITGAAPLDSASATQVTFATAHVSPDRLARTQAGILIADGAALDPIQAGELPTVVARSDNARLDFIRVLQRHFARAAPAPGIDPTAVVSRGAEISQGATIGPRCTVADDVRVGDGAVVEAGVHIYPGVTIGARVRVRAGAVIGADGYGYERDTEGVLQPFPQLGGVIIEDDAEIGANTTIDRGALGNTVIGTRARIDNLVHVAHNVRVGADAAVIAHAMLGGSAVIGDGAWIAPCACIREGVDIGAGAVVGLGAVVVSDVPPGTTVMGNPARERTVNAAMQRGLKRLAAETTGVG